MRALCLTFLCSALLTPAVAIDTPSAPEPSESKGIDIPCIFGLLKPCGANVTLPHDGLNLSTPFGAYHIPGIDELHKDISKVDAEFSDYTVYAVAAGLGIYIILSLGIPKRRRTFVEAVKKAVKGDLHDEDHHASEEELKKEKEEQMDPGSENFICPGNIFRVLGVMHPGVIGYTTWVQYAMQAGICAYMQLYLPVNIIKSVLKEWSITGVKTPLYFVFQGFNFMTQFAALGSICNLFASKCSLRIKHTAEAAYFLLTHDEPEGGDEEGGNAAVPPAAELAEAAEGGDFAKVMPKLPSPPAWVINANEFVWIFVSLIVDILMGLSLTLCIFLKIATFDQDMTNVAIIAVSLYFVMDLDVKVMEADKHLKPRFRRQVLKQTVVNEHHPQWVLTLGAFAAHLVGWSVPFGLLFIVLFGWKNSDGSVVIGGNPF